MTMPVWSIADLFEGLIGDDTVLATLSSGDHAGLEIHGLSLDSRLVQAGDLYLAVSGASTHGLRFAEDAIMRGAVAVAFNPAVLDSNPELDVFISSGSVSFIPVPELEQQCANLATRFYHAPDETLDVIAVTGTDGKTSVCQFIASALSATGTPCGYIGTLGWGLGSELQDTALTTPDVITLRRMLASLKAQGAEAVAMEASSHGIDTGRLAGLSVKVAVLTNLGRDHLDYHKTVEAYREAKAALFAFPSLEAIVVNADDELGTELLRRATQSGVNRIAYASSSGASDIQELEEDETLDAIRADHVHSVPTGLQFSLIDSNVSHEINSALMGRFNVDNLLACYGSLKALGVAANEAVHALEAVTPVAGRMECFTGAGMPTVIVDYAHTPQALSVALTAARAHCDGELWVVFGCGGDRDRGKRAPMAQAAVAADRVIVTDDNPRSEASADIINDILEGFTQRAIADELVTVINDRAMAIEHAIRAASAADIVLVAGKGHEDYQIVGTERRDFSDRLQVESLLKEAS